MGEVRSVGVLQLYNRIASDILQDDLERVHFIRKLLGSMLASCELFSMSLELMVGMARAAEMRTKMNAKLNSL